MAPLTTLDGRPLPRVALSGPQKVAALLLAMGKPVAGQVMAKLTNDEIRLVTSHIAELRPVTGNQLDAIVEEFASQLAKGPQVVGDPALVAQMLQGILPQAQIDQIIADISGRANQNIWDRVSQIPDNNLASYIMKEHPQTAALILSKLKPAATAKILGQCPERFRNEITRRMLTSKPVVDKTMKIIERTLYDDLLMNFSRNMGTDSHARMANIINKMEREHMESVLGDLAATHPKSADILKGLLFTFDDLINLTERARTLLFDQIEPDKIVLALKGTDPEFRNVILSSMAARTRRMVESELTGGQPASQRDVSEARRAIAERALDMANRGEIELHSRDDDMGYIQ